MYYHRGRSTVYPTFRRAFYTTLVLYIAFMIGVFDKQLLSLLVGPLKMSLRVKDWQIGALQGVAYTLCYGAALLPVGTLVDSVSRVRLLFFAIIGWIIVTVLSGISGSFLQLFACRMGLGAFEAGMSPAAYSLITDLYPPRKRNGALFIFYAATVLGTGAAISLCGAGVGYVAQFASRLPLGFAAMAPWRLTFLAASLPGLLVSLLFLTLSEPQRKDAISENAVVSQRSALTRTVGLRSFAQDNWKTFLFLFGGLICSKFGYEALLTWAPTILVRSFGWTAAQAGEWFGLSVAVGSGCGIALGVILNRLLDRRWSALTPLKVARLGALPTALATTAFWFVHTGEQFLIVATVHILFAFVGLVMVPRITMNLGPNHLRGRLMASYLFGSVIVAAVSPVLVGAFSDHAFPGINSLFLSFRTVVTPVCFLAPIALAFAGGPFRRTMNIPLASPPQLPSAQAGF